MIKYLIFRIFSVLIPFTAYYITDAFACIAGHVIFRTGNWRVSAIRNNLRAIGCGDAKIKQVFINMIINYTDFIRSFYMSKKSLLCITKFNSEKPENQFILLTGHYGNWELGGVILSAKGFNLVTIAESQGPGERMYELFRKMRSSTSLKVLKLEDKMIGVKLDKAIRAGHNPVLLMDRDIMKTGVGVMMGSRPARIPKGPYYFAKKHNLQLCVGTFRRQIHPKYRYTCDMKCIENAGNIRKDAQNAIDEFIRQIHVKPEEWFAFDIYWEDVNE